MVAWLLGFVGGVALQLQQAALWPLALNVLCTLLALPLSLACWIWLPASHALGHVLQQARDSSGGGFQPLATRIKRLSQSAGRIILTATLAAAFAFGCTAWRASQYQAHALAPHLEGVDLDVVGLIAAMPQRGELGLRFKLEVESAQLAPSRPQRGLATEAARNVQLPDRLWLSLYQNGQRSSGAESTDRSEYEDLKTLSTATLKQMRPGERWALRVRLKAPHGAMNPHGFDYELWLWEQGLGATGYVRTTANDPAPRLLGQSLLSPSIWVERARQQVRDAVIARVPHAQTAGLIAALVVGDQNAIERSDWDVFRATGVAHLMSISGLHVTLFAWVAAALVGWLWRRSALHWPAQRLSPSLFLPAPHAALVCGLLLAAAYAWFSGWGVPAQRTVLMLGTVALLRLSGRRWPWTMTWLLCLAVVLAVDPWAFLQPGFWLSFVAVGVLFASNPKPELTSASANPSSKDGAAHADVGASATAETASQRESVFAQFKQHRLVALLWRMLREQWVIGVALMPLMVILFQQVSLVGFVANLFAIPWVTLMLTPLGFLGVVFPPCWDLAAWVAEQMVECLYVLAKWPWAVWTVPAPKPAWALWALLGAVLLGWSGLPSLKPWWWRSIGAVLMLPVLLPQALGLVTPIAQGQFEILAADIGQGNAVLVRTAHHALLYDTGPSFGRDSDAGQRVLVPLLRALGVQLNMVVLSHRDSDHTGGARAVLTTQPNATVLSSIEPEHALQQVRPAQRCERGQSWLWDGVRFEVLHPQASDYEQVKKPNALSCVLKISSAPAVTNLPGEKSTEIGSAKSALLTGDIEAAQERQLLDGALEQADQAAKEAGTKHSPNILKSDWLSVPHHGSKTSSTAEFLNTVSAPTAVVQAGYRNRFGHPVSTVIQRLRESGTVVYTSPACGALHWKSADAQVVCERDLRRRYWHHSVNEN
jgi:competence protein ComEC